MTDAATPSAAPALRATTRLRRLLAAGRTVFVPGCFNAVSARVIEMTGFEAVYMTGYGTSVAQLGMPDVGFATMTEMHTNARWIANAVSIPVIADADNGYGNAVNVTRTVREYIQTGVAAIHLEDQSLPKRCGHVAGRQVISRAEAAGKIRAADAVRRQIDPDFVLIARSDARGAVGGSLDDAIDRVNAYLDAGADLGFVEGPTSVAEVERNLRMMDSVIRHMSVLLAKDLDAEAIAVDPEEIKVRRIEVTDADDDADETFEASLGLADVERPVHVHAPVQSQPAPEAVEAPEVPTPAGDA